MERNDFSAADGMAEADPLQGSSVRARIRHFIARHAVAWEVAFAILALISVALDFGFEGATGETADRIFWAQVGLTAVFAIEFFGRLWAAVDRRQHLREHIVDAVA